MTLGLIAELAQDETLAGRPTARVVAHVAAVASYALWKRDDVARPTITGWKRVRTRR